MWYPKNSLYSTNTFNSHNTGDYWYQSFSGQNHIGGIVSLRNIATGDKVIVSPGEPWPNIGWDKTNEFSYTWAANSPEFLTSGGTITQNTVFASIGLTGTTTIFQQNNVAAPTSGKFFGSNVNFDTGFIIQSSVMISRLTGIPINGNNTYGFMIRRGTAAELVRVQEYPLPGFVIGTGEYETYIPAPNISNQLTSFRLGVRGTPPLCTGHFITQDGYHAIITGFGRWAGTKIDADGIAIGNISSYIGGQQQDLSSRIEVGNLYQKHGLIDLYGDFISDTEYSKTALTFKTDSYKPLTYIDRWERAYISLVGPTGGTVSVIPEIRNSSNTNWRPLLTVGSTGIIRTQGQTGGLFWLDLSTGNSVAPARDGSDEIRFEINQLSADGTTPSLGVDYITVCHSKNKNNGIVGINPEVGSSEGEYPVLLTISPDTYKNRKRQTLLERDTELLIPLDGEGTLVGSKYYQRELVYGSNAVIGTNDNTYEDGVDFSDLSSGALGYQCKNFKGGFYAPTVLDQIFGTGSTVFNTPDGQLLAAPNFSITYPSSTGGGIGNFTDPPTINGGYLHPYYSPVRQSIQPLVYPSYSISPIVYNDISNRIMNYNAQIYDGLDGYGFETPEINMGSSSTGQYTVVEAVIQVDEGNLGMYITGAGLKNVVSASDMVTYSSYRYGNRQRVRTIFPGAQRFCVQFVGLNENNVSAKDTVCRFNVADVKVAAYNNSPVACVASNASFLTGLNIDYVTPYDFSIDIWTKPDGHPYVDQTTGNLFNLTFDDGPISLGIGRNGYPVFRYGTIDLTGAIGIDTLNWHHLLGQYKSNSNRMELYLDGQNCGMKHAPFVGIATDVNFNLELGRFYVGALEQARIRTTTRTAQQIQTLDSFAAPLKFVSQYQLQTGGSNLSLYRFDKGTMIDFGTGAFHAYAPDLSGQYFWTERNNEGVFGEGIGFLGNKGGAVSNHQVTAVNSNQFSFAGYMANLTTPGTPRIFKWGDYELSINQGRLVFRSATSRITGSYTVDETMAYSWFLVNYEKHGTAASITGWYGTGVGYNNPVSHFASTTMVAGATPNDYIYFGHDPTNPYDYGEIHLDEFAIHTGHISTGIMPYTVMKSAPEEYVYLNSQLVATGRVQHLGVYDKQILMPARSDFSDTGGLLVVSVNSQIGRLRVEPLFTYVGARKLIPDSRSKALLEEYSNNLCKTKSPFRIGVTAPSNSVNIAYVTSTPFTPDTSVGVIESPETISDNFVNSLKSYKVLSPVLSGTALSSVNSIGYTGQILTDDVNISNYTMIRDGVTFSAPLFYKHKLGGSQYYLYLDGGTNNPTTDYVLIRSSIQLLDDAGNVLDVAKFPWDIRISKYRIDGVSLPSNVYNVEILTRDKFIPGITIFVRYNAVNPVANYAQLRSYVEVLNTESIFSHKNNNSLEESFTTIDGPSFDTLRSSNSIPYNPGPTVIVNHITGDFWNPWVHRNDTYESDL